MNKTGKFNMKCNLNGFEELEEKCNIEKGLLVACFDGNIYSFKGPNIDYYLELDKEFRSGGFL